MNRLQIKEALKWIRVPHMRGDEPEFRGLPSNDLLDPTCVGMNRQLSCVQRPDIRVPHMLGVNGHDLRRIPE